MKRTVSYLLVCSIMLVLCRCDKGFEKINTNPALSSNLEPSFLFANAEFSAGQSTIGYPDEIVQQLITPFTGVLEGGNHNVYYDPTSTLLFDNFYTGSIKLLTDVLDRTKNDTGKSNLYNMARIMRAYVSEILVDTYGDVPYSEAGKSFVSGINRPKYDKQAEIYDDLLKEVVEATKALDASKNIVNNDIFYAGDIAKWKRLGNSLLLRIAMRLTKVNPDKAKQFVQIAVDPSNGGVMESNDDDAVIRYNNLFTNSTSSPLLGSERANYYVGKPFLDSLKSTNDPRLSVIAIKYANPNNPLETAGAGDTDPAHQEGMPYGYNEQSIVNAPGFPGKNGAAFNYSQFSRETVINLTAPRFLITCAQTQLLLAEAAQRGWISGSTEIYYEAGVKGALDQMKMYGDMAVISNSDQSTYLAENPFDPSNALSQINTQYWIASFLNGSEAWANFRRSGYPSLLSNPYPEADPAVKGAFIHRLQYPAREKSANTKNYEDAVSDMGGDDMSIHVFWDK
jgi:hypothetical protein